MAGVKGKVQRTEVVGTETIVTVEIVSEDIGTFLLEVRAPFTDVSKAIDFVRGKLFALGRDMFTEFDKLGSL